MNRKLVFVKDVERCVKCRACETACKRSNGIEEPEIRFRKVRILESGAYPTPRRRFVSMACNHCESAPCVRACPTNALQKDPATGVVIHRPERCMGCRYCTFACPYDAISYDRRAGTVAKCSFCIDKIAQGLDPACVTACMSGALQYGTKEDFDFSGLTRDLPGIPASSISEPNLYYRTRLGPSRRLENERYRALLARYTPTLCMICGSQCGVLVRLEGSRVTDVRPNPACPNNVSNNSRVFREEVAASPYAAKLCAKGYAAAAALDDPDRVRTPLKRLGERGEGRWASISWEEAYQEIAERLRAIRDRYGPHTLLWMSEDASYVDIQKDFCQAFGTPNFMMHSNLCDVARKAGATLAFGHPRPLADLSQTRLAVLFGWNPVAAIKWSHLVPDLMRAKERGAELVVIDPVLSDTAAKANQWIPIRPGTDAALALALAQVLIAERLYDEGFAARWSTGFGEFCQWLKDKTPQWAEEITGISASTIVELARKIGTTKPCAIDGWSGPEHHSNGTLAIYAIMLLNGLVGMLDERGGLHIPSERCALLRRAPHPDWPRIQQERVDGAGSRYPLGHESGVYTEAIRAVLEGTPYQPRALILNFQNIVLSIPSQERTIEALHRKELELVVAIDTMMSDTAALADFVIPGTVFLERTDLAVFWVNYAAVGLRQAVLPPRFGQPTEPDFIIGLARRLGLTGFELSYESYLDQALKRSIGIGLGELKSLPGAVWVGNETQYRKYTANAGNRPGFSTPSGKVEFRSELLAGLINHRTGQRYSGFPEYFPPETVPGDAYPFYLVTWKQAEHTHTRTQNNPWLMGLKPENFLWVNRETGASIGLEEGEEVELASPYGKGTVRVHLTDGIHPEAVGLHHGYGAKFMGRLARGRGVSDNIFLQPESERLSGMAIHKEMKVRINRL
ncbi:MAG: molybdopterin-dependent oxidoreductase [Myxococcales bacterium]|nr:molybdopterin-dependent oxidoreductase [Myxococcales bacterium]